MQKATVRRWRVGSGTTYRTIVTGPINQYQANRVTQKAQSDKLEGTQSYIVYQNGEVYRV